MWNREKTFALSEEYIPAFSEMLTVSAEGSLAFEITENVKAYVRIKTPWEGPRVTRIELFVQGYLTLAATLPLGTLYYPYTMMRSFEIVDAEIWSLVGPWLTERNQARLAALRARRQENETTREREEASRRDSLLASLRSALLTPAP